MNALARRLSSVSLLWQLLVPILLCVAIAIAGVQLWSVRHTRTLLQERLTASLGPNLAMLRSDVDRPGGSPRRDGDRLLIGDALLNGRNDIVDRVADVAGGVATIFAGDTRVATTIHNADGGRAVGTLFAAGPARTATLDRGETYRGAATILGKDYVTIYQPLKDASGTVAGVLFVGLPTADTEATLEASEWQTALITLAVLAALGGAVGFLLRGLLSPLQAMTQAMRRLASGELNIEIPAVHRGDQVGRMAWRARCVQAAGVAERPPRPRTG